MAVHWALCRAISTDMVEMQVRRVGMLFWIRSPGKAYSDEKIVADCEISVVGPKSHMRAVKATTTRRCRTLSLVVLFAAAPELPELE